MTQSRFIIGDVFDGLAALNAEGTQVDLVLTSPPFLALRSYLPAEHPGKGKEIGAEPTPAAFLSTMLDVVEACAEVLTPTGTLAFEFGDTYAGSGGAGGDYNPDGLRAGQETFDGSSKRAHGTDPMRKHSDDLFHQKSNGRWRTTDAGTGGKHGWPMDKSLCMVPELFAASLAYGRNLLAPDRTTDPWRIRNTIAWVRPNPPVGALGDKFRPAKSLITVAAKARDRWFDLDAVRTEPLAGWRERTATTGTKGPNLDRGDLGGGNFGVHAAGAPPLDWWKISPGGFSGSHYAVWPPELLHRPIEAMCPRRVCRTCGTPSRRVVDLASHGDWARPEIAHTKANHGGPGTHGDRARDATTTGWTTCGCPGSDGIRLDGYHTGTGWRPGIVLDPFGGSGTTGLVANGLSRDAILLDLDERNADLARERLGMFMTVEYAARESAA